MSYAASWQEHQDYLRRGGCPIAFRLPDFKDYYFGLAQVDLTWNVYFVQRCRAMTCRWDASTAPGPGRFEKLAGICDAVIPMGQVLAITFLDPKVWCPFLEDPNT